MATDPLSLFFIGCFLFGLLFLLVTIVLGNLGHAGHAGHMGHATHVSHSVHGSHAQAGGHTHGTGSSHPTSQAHSTHGQGQERGQASQSSGPAWFAYINPTSIVFFLIGFGFFGYVFHTTAHFLLPITLLLSGISGLVIAGLLLLLFSRIFSNIEGETEQDVADRTGLLGTVSIPIQENGMGEILYTSPAGLRKSIPARSVGSQRLERGQEVVVVNYAQGVAEVDTWEHFINEQGVEDKAPIGYEGYAGNTEQSPSQAAPQSAPRAAPAADEIARLRALLEEADNTGMEVVIRNEKQKE